MSENKIKQFRFKLTHFILPCGQLLYKWKLKANPLCMFCDCVDSYEHLFFNCNRLDILWKNVKKAFKFLGFENLDFCLKTLILGYKIGNASYYWVNEVISLICFVILKAFV